MNGTASLTIPLPLSEGRRGFGPDLALTYDSGVGNGPFGLGWTLSSSSITRATDRGVPRYVDQEESDPFLLSGAEHLVPVDTTLGSWPQEHNPPPGYAIRRYRPRLEGLFARIERWTKQNTGEQSWRVISHDNITTWYGRTAASRVADPSDPRRVAAWLICESHDDKGNAIVYEYVGETADGVDLAQTSERSRAHTANRYLKRVRYGNTISRLVQPDLSQTAWTFEVVFDYDEAHVEEVAPDPCQSASEQHRFVRASDQPGSAWAARPDPFSSHRVGFEVRSHRRCRRVLMFHRFTELGTEPCLVRSLEFDYADLGDAAGVPVALQLAHPGSTPSASFLCGVTQSGYVRDDTVPPVDNDGTLYLTYLQQSLPRLELEYSRPVVGDQVKELDVDSEENLPIGVDALAYHWVDLDGEGIPGILTEQASAWFYKPNVGEGRFGPQVTVAARPSGPMSGHDRQLVDLAGDGQLDLAVLDQPIPGFYERTADRDWHTFRPFTSVPTIDWTDPNLCFIDLNGDGHADVLVTDDEVFRWYSSLAEDGFGPVRRAHLPADDDAGPRLVVADGTNSIHLADMSGDGLTDLVRVRNGEVCYWPNQGYGRFGPKVVMNHAPRFEPPDRFDPRRLWLADIDGSGTADMVHLGRDGVELYFNEAGNGWTGPHLLDGFPAVAHASVTTADLLGNGTTCLVWSSSLPGESGRPMRYVELMAEGKPYLLVGVANNLGAETRIRYAPSSTFYLEDQRAGQPWVTRIPFPVHVVERVETKDVISGVRLVARYAYHHGYYDGVEREFRGFGLVEQWDCEERAPGSGPSWRAPPMLTRTWFHTGARLGGGHTSDFIARIGEYYRPPGASESEARPLLDISVLPSGLTSREEREAYRALKGSMLRQEIYALDSSPDEPHPYAVTERSYGVRQLQAGDGTRHAVFHVHGRETLSHHYERHPVDPRIGHTLVLEVDDFGNVLKDVTIGYGRQGLDTRLAGEDQAAQARTLITYGEHDYTVAVTTVDDHRTPLPCESRVFELTGYQPSGPAGRFTASDFTTPDPLDPSGRRRVNRYDAEIDYCEVATAGRQRRLTERSRTLYRSDDLTDMLPPGVVQSRALPGDHYVLALTADLVAQVYANRVGTAVLETECGYVDLDADGAWWAPSGRIFYSPSATDSPAQELSHATQHFFVPARYRDPFHTATASTEIVVTYDDYDLLVRETRDPLGNRVTVGERHTDPTRPLVVAGHDYRVLEPTLVMDVNRNRSRVAFDALGLVVATALMGKPEESPVPGDRLPPSLRAHLTEAEIERFVLDPTGPETALLLDDATTRIVHDLGAYARSRAGGDPEPAMVATLERETHVSEVPAGSADRVLVSIAYSDGFGREIQRKADAPPGPIPARDGSGRVVLGADGRPQMMTGSRTPRWLCSGWTEFDGKGRPVRRYEPFFTDISRYERDARIGLGSTLLYDATGRPVATLQPDHTWTKVVIGVWSRESWDANDTVLLDPATDPEVGPLVAGLDKDRYQPTWRNLRLDPAYAGEAQQRWSDPATRQAEQDAATKAAAHAGTPTVAHTDGLGRIFVTVENNRAPSTASGLAEEHLATRLHLDIEGNERAVIDPARRTAFRYGYDLRGHRINETSMDAGDQVELADVAGQTVYTWTGRGHRTHVVYDRLRRPTHQYVRVGPQTEELTEYRVYGESVPDAETRNLRGAVADLFDQAGRLTTDLYDFKGNSVRSSRQLTEGYSRVVDWSHGAALQAGCFTEVRTHDALNRPRTIVTTTPAMAPTTVRFGYDRTKLVNRVDVNLRAAAAAGRLVWTTIVADIAYDARGQRLRVDQGNGVRISYDYDSLTSRLRLLTTRRDRQAFPDDCPQLTGNDWPGCDLQRAHYTHDPVGNVTEIRDEAQQAVFFRNRRVDSRRRYTYDATYRLVESTGREHLGQGAGPPTPYSHSDAPRTGHIGKADGKAMARFVELYRYDLVGNLLEVRHRRADSGQAGWTRTYHYAEPSDLEPGTVSNRLTRTTVGSTTEVYSTAGDGYDDNGNMMRMPHLSAIEWDHLDRLRLVGRQSVSGGPGRRTWYVRDATGERVREVTERADGAIATERVTVGIIGVDRAGQGSAAVPRETIDVMLGDDRIAVVETDLDGPRAGAPPTPLVRYQYADHLGSVGLELDGDGQLISYEEYSAFGSSLFQSFTVARSKRFRFGGRERHQESGLCHHGDRVYVPWLGRWSGCDPDPPDVERVGLYVYARNNPVRYIDPTGRAAESRFQSGLNWGLNALRVIMLGYVGGAVGLAVGGVGGGFLGGVYGGLNWAAGGILLGALGGTIVGVALGVAYSLLTWKWARKKIFGAVKGGLRAAGKAVMTGLEATWGATKAVGRWIWGRTKAAGRSIWGQTKRIWHGTASVARSVWGVMGTVAGAVGSALRWVAGKIADAFRDPVEPTPRAPQAGSGPVGLKEKLMRAATETIGRGHFIGPLLPTLNPLGGGLDPFLLPAEDTAHGQTQPPPPPEQGPVPVFEAGPGFGYSYSKIFPTRQASFSIGFAPTSELVPRYQSGVSNPMSGKSAGFYFGARLQLQW